MKLYAPYLAILKRIKSSRESDLIQKHRLYCEAGEWLNCAVLKLQKKTWSDNGMNRGIFFSIWIGEKELQRQRFNYNIHALKLRCLAGHAIASREFATSFRARFAKFSNQWPNVSSAYGPQTLMQGWQKLNDATFEYDINPLIDGFVAMHHIIDDMLAERETPHN